MRLIDRILAAFRPAPVLRPEMFRAATHGAATEWRPSVGTMRAVDDHFEFLTQVGWVDAAALCRRAGMRGDRPVPLGKMVELARAYVG